MKALLLIWRFFFPSRVEGFRRWPAARNCFGKDRYIICGDMQTPFRVHLIDENLINPLRAIYKLLWFLLITNFFLVRMEIFHLLHVLRLDSFSVLLMIGGLTLVYGIEKTFRLPLCRTYLGRGLSVKFTPEKIIIWSGFLKRKTVSRNNRITFSHVGFKSPNRQSYHDATKFIVIKNDQEVVFTQEFYDLKLVDRFVESCNKMNTYSQTDRTRANDPRDAILERNY